MFQISVIKFELTSKFLPYSNLPQIETMVRLLVIGLVSIGVLACGKRKDPDVSNIEVDLQLLRFEQDFFAVDTSNIDAALQQLNTKYPGFLQDFVFNILALPGQPDSAQVIDEGIRSFIATYDPVKESANKVFGNFQAITNEVKSSLQHVFAKCRT
jgi:hypothetical protein